MPGPMNLQVCGSRSIVDGNDFAAVSSAERSPDRQVDAVANQRSASIATCNLDTTGMLASCGEHAVAAGVHIENVGIGTLVVVVCRVILATVDPTTATLSVVTSRDRNNGRFELIGIHWRLKAIRETSDCRWNSG